MPKVLSLKDFQNQAAEHIANTIKFGMYLDDKKESEIISKILNGETTAEKVINAIYGKLGLNKIEI